MLWLHRQLPMCSSNENLACDFLVLLYYWFVPTALTSRWLHSEFLFASENAGCFRSEGATLLPLSPQWRWWAVQLWSRNPKDPSSISSVLSPCWSSRHQLLEGIWHICFRQNNLLGIKGGISLHLLDHLRRRRKETDTLLSLSSLPQPIARGQF